MSYNIIEMGGNIILFTTPEASIDYCVFILCNTMWFTNGDLQVCVCIYGSITLLFTNEFIFKHDYYKILTNWDRSFESIY